MQWFAFINILKRSLGDTSLFDNVVNFVKKKSFDFRIFPCGVGAVLAPFAPHPLPSFCLCLPNSPKLGCWENFAEMSFSVNLKTFSFVFLQEKMLFDFFHILLSFIYLFINLVIYLSLFVTTFSFFSSSFVCYLLYFKFCVVVVLLCSFVWFSYSLLVCLFFLLIPFHSFFFELTSPPTFYYIYFESFHYCFCYLFHIFSEAL